MADNKKELERAELHKTIWAIADEMRGSSGGEFYTPQEVSELLAKLATIGKTEVNKVYDPACGSGSLLLKAAQPELRTQIDNIIKSL